MTSPNFSKNLQSVKIYAKIKPHIYYRRCDVKLLLEAFIKFLMGIILVGAMLFLPAGTLAYGGAWLFIILLFAPMLVLGAVLFVTRRDLLRKRLDSKEKEKTQKGIVSLSGLLFVVGFVVAGLDFRFSWSRVPAYAVTIASLVLLISYALYAEVMRENAYLSRKIEVSEGQKVVDKGMYAVVRHPMYAVTVFLFLSIPVVLGSWWSLLCFAPYVVLIAIRAVNEEKVLEAELEGYSDYKKKVKYRLVPFIW